MKQAVGLTRSVGDELQRDKKHLEECLAEVKEQEEEMSRANRALTTRLEDVQVA